MVSVSSASQFGGKSGLVIASAAGGDALFTLPYRFDTSSVWHTILKGHNANR